MNYCQILILCKKLSQILNIERSKLPYDINIISELHADETAHSRILRMFFEYKKDNNYPIFKSFIAFINSTFKTKILEKIESPIFTNEYDRIDLLIEEFPKYAIIIENKIYEARDQEKQIERYIDKCIKHHGISKDNIYLFYLTRDGRKEASDLSFTNIAKKNLNYEDEINSGRFYNINYMNHILPWLVNKVYPNCPVYEKKLISSLEQYINFLKKILNISGEDLTIRRKARTIIMKELKKLNINDLSSIGKIYHDLQILQDNIRPIIKNKIEKIAKEKIIIPLEKKLEGGKIHKYEFDIENIHIQISLPNWHRCCFRINTETPMIYGVSYYDDAIDSIDKKTKHYVFNTMSKLAFKQSDWWPCYKSVQKKYQDINFTFWENIENGSCDISGYFIDCYTEVIEKLKNIKM